MHSTLNVDSEPDILHPLYDTTVYISSENKAEKDSLRKRLLEKDVEVNIESKLSHAVCVILVRDHISENDKTTWEELAFNGYNIPILTERELERIESNPSLKRNCKFPVPQKNFDLNYERLFLSKFSPLSRPSKEDLLNEQAHYFFYIDKELQKCSSKIDPKGENLKEYVKQIANVETKFFPQSTTCCILRESTIDKLKRGLKDNFIREIEYKYNTSDVTEFKYKFFRFNDFIDFVKEYIEKDNNILSRKNDEFKEQLSYEKEQSSFDRVTSELCHYTNINALSSILQVKSIILRASNIFYLNDEREVVEGLGIVKKFYQDIKQYKARFPQKLRNWGKYFDKINKGSFANYYVTSFCGSNDDLPMWVMYANNGRGCALIFDSNTLKKEINNTGFLSRCIYSPAELLYSFDNIRSKITTKKVNFQDIISKICLSTKHSGFWHENEWRGVFLKSIKKQGHIIFREKNNYVVPYIELVIPKKALKQIILGPNTNELTLKSVENLLRINGYTDVTVTKSKLPYRG